MFKFEYFKEHESEIRNKIDNGMSISKCSEDYDLTRETLTKYLNNNIQPKVLTKNYKQFLKHRIKIINLYSKLEYSIRELSEHYSINRATLKSYLELEKVYEKRTKLTERSKKRKKESMLKNHGVVNPGEIKNEKMQKSKSKKISDYRKSNLIWKGENNPNYKNKIGNNFGFKAHFRKDLNNYFRSSWEANFARILNYFEVNWEYENHNFKISNDSTYTPDFYLPKYDCFVEIKGYWFDDGEIKFNKFKELNKNLKIKLIEKDEYMWIINRLKNKISFE